MMCISLYNLCLQNFLNKMSFIVCDFIFLGNHVKYELIRVCGRMEVIKEELNDH